MSLLYIIKYYNKFGANITCQTGGKNAHTKFGPLGLFLDNWHLPMKWNRHEIKENNTF